MVKFKRTKAHIVYKTKDGKRVPGTTTITGLLDKSRYLVPWANRLGLEGINSTDYVDTLAGVGTLAHDMAHSELTGEPMEEDLSEYSPKEIDLAHNALIKFLNWMKENDVKPLLTETPLVSEKYHYGGTIDNYCELNGVLTLVDFKTSKAIYTDMIYQLSAYKNLLEEHGCVVDGARILRIGRDESEGAEERQFSPCQLEAAWEVFKRLREIYDLQKVVGR